MNGRDGASASGIGSRCMRPFGYFIYAICSGLVPDGKEALSSFPAGVLYRLLVDINRDELTANKTAHSELAEPAPAKD